jgi:hypothetical protein
MTDEPDALAALRQAIVRLPPGPERQQLEQDLRDLERMGRELAPEATLAEFLGEFGLANVCDCCGLDPQEEDDDKLYDLGWVPTEDLGILCPTCAVSPDEHEHPAEPDTRP